MQTPERAGQLGLGAGGERAGLLVAHADPLDALLAADRVGDRVERVADDAPDVRDAEVGERGDDRLGDGRHAGRSLSATVGAKLSGSARSQSSRQLSGRIVQQLPGLEPVVELGVAVGLGVIDAAHQLMGCRPRRGSDRPIEAMICCASRDGRLLVAVDPLGLVGDVERAARRGSWVATPTGHSLVWQRCAWMQPTAFIIARAALV